MRAFLFNLLRSIQFIFLVSSFLNPFVSPTQQFCHPDQRDALLDAEFGIQKPSWVDKYGFFYSDVSCYPKTKSWANNSDCCFWDGIMCDAKSGEVVGIDLSASCLHGRLESNSSLFRLRQLRDLNLAYNNFTTSPIPAEFDKLKGLERLNLSKSSFSGQVPNKLTKLVSLDLSSSSLFMYHYNSLSVDESFLPLLAYNLRNLKHLDMSFINISSKIPHEFSNMQSLKSLRFEDCNLFGEIPSSLGNLSSLSNLDLSSNNFIGKIPSSLGNLSSLSNLDLNLNNFIGEIPSSIGNLKQLETFEVDGNKFSGNFPSGLLNLTHLLVINLCSNHFSGFLPPNISQFSNLERFLIYSNSFTGVIPSYLFKIPSLVYIDLDNNQFSDLVGIENIFLLPDLQVLYLGNSSWPVQLT